MNNNDELILVNDVGLEDVPSLQRIEPGAIDNIVIRRALERIKERCQPSHASYYTKHSSHSRYSKGW